MSDNFAGKFDKTILILIKGVIFLLPLFFLPWTSEGFELAKQFLLWLLMPAAAMIGLYKMAARKQIKIKNNPLNLPILIFLSLTAVSSWFSLDRFSSFFGYFGRFSDAWFGLFSLALFYFLMVNAELADSTRKIIDLWKLFLYSSIMVAAVFLFTALGGPSLGEAGSAFSWPPLNLAGSSLLALAVLLAVVAVALADFLLSGYLNKFDRFIFRAGLIICLMVLTLVNFSLSWISLFLGAGLIILFRRPAQAEAAAGKPAQRYNFKKTLNYYLSLPLALMLLAVLMLALPNAHPVKSVSSRAEQPNGINLAKKILGREFPQEAMLDYSQALDVSQEAVFKNPALGSGPGTYAADFSRYRPAELNNGPFWQIRFDKSGSHLLEMLATGGLLTVLSYLLVVSLLIYLTVVLIRKHFTSQNYFLAGDDYNLIAALFTVFILVFFFQFFFLANTVLNFIFWLGLSLVMAFWQNRHPALFKEKIIDLSNSKISYWSFFSGLLMLTVGWMILLTFEVKFLAADIMAVLKPKDEINLLTAVKLNPYRYNYRISLAEIYLNQARAEALKPIEQRNNLNIKANITEAVEMAKQAQILAPHSVLAQETMGMIYRDSRPLTSGSEPWAVRSFARAFELEPTNPVLATELGKAYFNHNETANAEEYFKTALALKSDYYEAKFWLAKTYLNNKKDNQALGLLNELARQVPTADVYYELGRYYYNRGEIDKAIERFKLALTVSPRHSNSLYSLGIAYEAQGKIKEALRYLEKVLELNPWNEEVNNKIKALGK